MGCIKSTCPIKIVKNTVLPPQKVIKPIKTIPTQSNQSDSSIKIKNLITKSESRMEDNYKILCELGRGGFGSVFKVQHYKTKTIYAMKVVRKINKTFQEGNQTFLQEIEILITLEHPNIIKIYEYYEDEINYYLITEYVSGGELFDYIERDTTFCESKAKKIIKQILQALNYLHSNNLVHRDIKSENILVEYSYAEHDDVNIKIIDFGTCNYVTQDKHLTMKVGSPYYIAPEVLKSDYNNKCDIWSTGIILYIMLIGFPPFSGNNYNDMYQNIQKAKLNTTLTQWQLLSENSKDLITKMLNKDINARLNAQECLNHPWFNELDIQYNNKHSNKLMNNVLNNIVSFNAKEKLQQSTIAYIVHFLYYSEDLNQLKNAFKDLDVNNDGMLTLTELKNGFDRYFGKGISEMKLQEIMEDIDGNNDGVISYEEFLRVAIKKEELIEEQNLKLAFEKFDTNEDGKLSKEEIKKVLYAANFDYINILLKEIDTNGDGYLNYEEFKNLMNAILMNKEIIINKQQFKEDERELKEKQKQDISYSVLVKDILSSSNEKYPQKHSIIKYYESIDKSKKSLICKCDKLKGSTKNVSLTVHELITFHHMSGFDSKIFDKHHYNINSNDNSIFHVS